MNSPFLIPYGRQFIDKDDIQSVVDVLTSDWLTTGPKVTAFEEAVCTFTGAGHGVAVSSGTAALHAAIYAVGITPGDEVIVPSMTFVATANCVVYQGGRPVFADVETETLLINPSQVEELITPKTKAIIAVDYAGQPCDYSKLRAIANRNNLVLIADACHSLGATYNGSKVGTLADMTVFSFHPVKHITTGEGGMIVTNKKRWANRMRQFRNHGINADHRQRERTRSWFYEMENIGFNYRLSDIHCALGISQLKKLPQWLVQRQQIAKIYDSTFKSITGLQLLEVQKDRDHAYHLYIVLFDNGSSRKTAFTTLRNAGIGVNVHYFPVHLHRYYQEAFNYGPGLCPISEQAYNRLLTLPIYPRMKKDETRKVIKTLVQLMATVNN